MMATEDVEKKTGLDVLSPTIQFLILGSGVFIFFGTHNILQEAMMKIPGFEFGVMLGYMEVVGVCLFSYLERTFVAKETKRVAPLSAYPLLTFCLLSSSSLSNLALNFINFPTKACSVRVVKKCPLTSSTFVLLSFLGCLSKLQTHSYDACGHSGPSQNVYFHRIPMCHGCMYWTSLICGCRLEIYSIVSPNRTLVSHSECLCRCHSSQCPRRTLSKGKFETRSDLLYKFTDTHGNDHYDVNFGRLDWVVAICSRQSSIVCLHDVLYLCGIFCCIHAHECG